MATLHVGEIATVKNNQVFFFFFFPYVSFSSFVRYRALFHYVSLLIIKSVTNSLEKILKKNCARFEEKEHVLWIISMILS